MSQNLDGGFVLEWPTDYRPLSITRPFTTAPTGTAADNMGVGIATQAGSKVLAAAAGTVTRQWAADGSDELGLGKYVQVTSQHGQTTYTVTYAGLSSVRIAPNTQVNVGDELGRVAGSDFTLIVQQPSGTAGYRLPNIIDPTPLIYVKDLRVRPKVNDLRVRAAPVDGDVIANINPWDAVTPLESYGAVLQKVGVEGQWLKITAPNGQEGYTAAWFVEISIFKPFSLDVNPVGVNLDQLHPLGTPDPSLLRGIGWVRFGYNVSNYSGSEDIQAAYDRYAPVVERYAKAGYKVVFTTSHQTYGEGKNEFWPWPEMTDQKWTLLTERFADMMSRIAQQWAGKGLVHCWQVWNEQDAPIGAVASVPMTSANYGRMLQKIVPAIKSADSNMQVVTGGHTSGPGRGSQYAKEALSLLDASNMVDGIAFHPYGRGADANSPYAPFGHIDDSIRSYGPILPDKPLWITEWGVLDRGGDPPANIAQYAMSFINYLKSKYPGRVACMIWYAWAEGMHNGYGIVDGNSQPRQPLTDQFLQA